MHKASVETDSTSYSIVIKACAQKGDAEKASQWFRWMQEASVQPDVMSYVAILAQVFQFSVGGGGQHHQGAWLPVLGNLYSTVLVNLISQL